MKTYIIHVSNNIERKEYIEKQLKETKLDVTYIIKGDKKDLSKNILNTYFKGEVMCQKANHTSCTYKHLLAYEEILKDGETALILEDDIFFYKNFEAVLNNILTEIKENELKKFFISIEDSILRYVEKSIRTRGKLLYQKENGRLAGAYLIDKYAAESILNKVKKDKVDLPIDWFHNVCAKENLITIYWSHPTICCQKSLDGSMQSTLDNKKHGLFRKFSFRLQKIYKKTLYQFR